MPNRPASGRGPRARRRVAGTLAAVSVLVGALAGCTAGTVTGTSPAGGGTPGATPTPTVTDPAAAIVRATGVALTPNGAAVNALTAPPATAAGSTDADGSVHLRVTPEAGPVASAGSAGAVGAVGAAGGPLAWLTGPAGSTAAVLEDGSAVITAADGAFLVGLSAPTPSARFTVVGTPAAVLRVDRVASGGLSTTAPGDPVTVWLSGKAVVSAVWGEAEGGRSLEVTPSEWARTGTLAAQQALWSQLVAQQPEAGSPSMHDQLLCHVLGAAGKSTWHIEPWRPQVDALTMLRTRCNPTAADVTAAPTPTTPAAG